jgi:RimJ/RimL family protein N-acetyltransferase
MFVLEGVTLRPLEISDSDRMYELQLDYQLDILASWGSRPSRSAFDSWMIKQMETHDDYQRFGIEYEGSLVGDIQLGLIDRDNRHAALGIVIGDRSVWGKGVGNRACRIMLDYAFTVRNLERVYAESYAFNIPSIRFLQSVGFTLEGIHRQHEVHNGMRHDMHYYGYLKEEFYARYPKSLFLLPDFTDKT